LLIVFTFLLILLLYEIYFLKQDKEKSKRSHIYLSSTIEVHGFLEISLAGSGNLAISVIVTSFLAFLCGCLAYSVNVGVPVAGTHLKED
jgi:hypothetical protein